MGKENMVQQRRNTHVSHFTNCSKLSTEVVLHRAAH